MAEINIIIEEQATVNSVATTASGAGTTSAPEIPAVHSTVSWYAVRVSTGKEDRARDKIREADKSGVIDEVFVPRCAYGVYDEQAQTWVPRERVMFPGYLIAIARCAADMEAVLRTSKVYAHALGDGEGAVRLSDDEVAFLDAFTKKGHRTIPVSEGRIEEGGRVVVVKGPLVGREAQIVKIKHRQKRAIVSMRMFNRDMQTELGLHVMRGSKR